MVRPRADAGLERKNALVEFVAVWKVRRSVGKEGKRIWRVYMWLFGMDWDGRRSRFEMITYQDAAGWRRAEAWTRNRTSRIASRH
jgi:hypothetical protein